MRLLSSLFAAVVCLSFAALIPGRCRAQAPQKPPEDLRQLRVQMVDSILKERPKNPGPVLDWAYKQEADGSWADIDYADKARGAWKPAAHMDRILQMTMAYRAPEGKYQGDESVAKAIHAALGYWMAKDYICPNWWFNEIGIPMMLSRAMLLMDAELTPAEREGGLKILNRAKISMTGQNRVWVAGITVTRGLVENDAAVVRTARDTIASEIVISTQEGVQPDYSYHQHGPQLQFGNYGGAFAGDQAKWANIFAGTPFAFDDAQIKILRDYMLEGTSKVLWAGSMDYNAFGRQFVKGATQGKGRGIMGPIRAMLTADPANAPRYQAVLDNSAAQLEKGNAITGATYFWRSDYLVDRCARYYASVRMSSRRVIGAELVNSENLVGVHEGQGAFCLFQTGHEYDDVFPVWDWSRVPGVTCAQNESPAALQPNGKLRVDSDFVGGVTNGTDGIATMDYRYAGVAARKSAFTVEGQIVFLGAGISGSGEIATSVNQCLLKGPVTASQAQEKGREGKVTQLPVGIQAVPNLLWAHHDGVGYVFPGGAKAHVGGQAQKGNWKRVLIGGSAEEETKDVFSLWLDHGTAPADGSYSYIVLPGATPEQMAAYAKTPRVQILCNTKSVQAIQHGSTTLAVFYQPGECKVDAKQVLAVNQPCTVIFENGEKPRISVASPTQQTGVVEVKFGGKAYPVTLPSEDGKAGSCVRVAL